MKAFKKIATVVCSTLLLLSSCLTVCAADSNVAPPTPEYTPTILGGTARIVADCFLQRLDPALNAPLVLSEGEDVTVMGRYANWFAVYYDDQVGFVYYNNLRFLEPVADSEQNVIGNSISILPYSEDAEELAIACDSLNHTVINPNEKFDFATVVNTESTDSAYYAKIMPALLNALSDTDIESLSYSSLLAGNATDISFVNTYYFPIELSVYSCDDVIFIDISKVKE